MASVLAKVVMHDILERSCVLALSDINLGCRPRPDHLRRLAAEVIDLRLLRPLDDAAVLAAVRKCRRAVIVDESWRSTAWVWRWLRRACSSFVEGAPQTDLSAQFPR